MTVKETEELIGQEVVWIDDSNVNSWSELDLPVPDIFFQAGWFLPSFRKLGKEVCRNGGKVVLGSDNCWKNNMRQWLGAIKFRLLYRKWASAVWVPGESGARLQRFLGMSPSQIYQGCYGVDHNCFTAGPPLTERPKQFIFVGGLTRLKGMLELVKAFMEFRNDFPEWKLVAYGAGEFQNLLESSPGIDCRPFAPPEEIAEALRQSRFFVLPTLTDHWPLVVAEASSVGCGLIVSNVVGNRTEFVTDKNGFIFPKGSAKELAKVLRKAVSMPDSWLEQAYEESKRRGARYGIEQWADKFVQIVCEVGEYSK